MSSFALPPLAKEPVFRDRQERICAISSVTSRVGCMSIYDLDTLRFCLVKKFDFVQQSTFCCCVLRVKDSPMMVLAKPSRHLKNVTLLLEGVLASLQARALRP